MDTFPYLGSLITEDGESRTYNGIRTRLNRGQVIEASPQKIRKSHSIPISTKIRLIEATVWSIANEWVHNKAGVKRELLDTVKARKLAYYGHTTRKQGSCLKKEITQGAMPGARRRGRSRTAWMDNIKTWTGLPMEESIRMTQDRDK